VEAREDTGRHGAARIRLRRVLQAAAKRTMVLTSERVAFSSRRSVGIVRDAGGGEPGLFRWRLRGAMVGYECSRSIRRPGVLFILEDTPRVAADIARCNFLSSK
jgi:hypothetical protein